MKVKEFLNKGLLSNLFMGFSSGMPLLLIGSTLQAWMTEENLSLADIGLITIVGIPHNLKFLAAPLLDRYRLPFLGRRRGWIFTFQLALALVLFLFSLMQVKNGITPLMGVAFFVALFSALQDIVIDAYRRESLHNEQLALGASYAVFGYRMAMIVSGAVALEMAAKVSWNQVYFTMSMIMLVCSVLTWFTSHESSDHIIPRTLADAVVGPLLNFFKRKGVWLVLTFVLFYKLGDSMGSSMSMAYYLKSGFDKQDVSRIAKIFGMVATIGGGVAGGALMLRLTWRQGLLWFGLTQAVSTIVFVLIHYFPGNIAVLASCVSLENFTSGLGTAAFVAYLSMLTDKRYTATQYALLTSLVAVPRTLLSAPSGYLVEVLDWPMFYTLCTIVAVPGILLVFKLPTPTESIG